MRVPACPRTQTTATKRVPDGQTGAPCRPSPAHGQGKLRTQRGNEATRIEEGLWRTDHECCPAGREGGSCVSLWAVQGGCTEVRSSELYRQCGRMPGGTARERAASSETRNSGDPAATGRWPNDKCELRLDSPTLPSSSLHSRLSRLLVKWCLRRWYRWSSSRPSGEDRMTPKKRTHLGSTVSCTRDRQDGVRRTPSPLAGRQRLRCDLVEAPISAG